MLTAEVVRGRPPSLVGLPDRWRRAPRRWGHPLHSMCSYMAMFPPTIPHVFIKWLTDPGDLVADPFAGRGTAPFEAALLGRSSFAGDANPLAYVLSGAKVQPPSKDALTSRLRELRQQRDVWRTDDEPAVLREVFDAATLGELLWLRSQLDVSESSDRFLMASLLGVLHLNANSVGRPRGLSVAMPNTFSMSPNYVRSYIQAKGLKPPAVSPLDLLSTRVDRCLPLAEPFVAGTAVRGDVHETCDALAARPAKLIFTSPPYLEVIRYGKFNWLRLWLLGEDPQQVDGDLFHSSSLTKYLAFMRRVLQSLRVATRDDGYVCLVIGDVRAKNTEINLAQEVVASCLPGSGLTLLGMVTDWFPTHRKVSRIWGENRGRATKVERIVILGGPSATLNRPLGRMAWSRNG